MIFEYQLKPRSVSALKPVEVLKLALINHLIGLYDDNPQSPPADELPLAKRNRLICDLLDHPKVTYREVGKLVELSSNRVNQIFDKEMRKQKSKMIKALWRKEALKSEQNKAVFGTEACERLVQSRDLTLESGAARKMVLFLWFTEKDSYEGDWQSNLPGLCLQFWRQEEERPDGLPEIKGHFYWDSYVRRMTEVLEYLALNEKTGTPEVPHLADCHFLKLQHEGTSENDASAKLFLEGIDAAFKLRWQWRTYEIVLSFEIEAGGEYSQIVPPTIRLFEGETNLTSSMFHYADQPNGPQSNLTSLCSHLRKMHLSMLDGGIRVGLRPNHPSHPAPFGESLFTILNCFMQAMDDRDFYLKRL